MYNAQSDMMIMLSVLLHHHIDTTAVYINYTRKPTCNRL